MGFLPPSIYLQTLLVKSNIDIGMQDNIRKDAFYDQSILIIEKS